MLNPEIKPRITIILFFICSCLSIIYLRGVLAPFFVALLLTYILYPLQVKLNQKFNISIKTSSLIISLIILTLVFLIPILIIPFALDQIKGFVDKIPYIINMLNQKIIIPLNNKFNLHIRFDINHIKSLLSDKKYSLNDLNKLSPIARNSAIVLESALYIILIPLVFYYSSIHWKNLINFIKELIPIPYKVKTIEILRDIDKILSSYLRGQLAVMLIMAIIYAVGLNFTGLPGATFIGIITGFLVFIPYVGFITGLILGLLMLLSQFEGMTQLIFVLAVFGVGNIIENIIVTPYLVGNSIGLNPVMIILSLLILGELFGLIGVVLSLPLTAVLVVLMHHWKEGYLDSQYYRGF